VRIALERWAALGFFGKAKPGCSVATTSRPDRGAPAAAPARLLFALREDGNEESNIRDHQLNTPGTVTGCWCASPVRRPPRSQRWGAMILERATTNLLAQVNA